MLVSVTLLVRLLQFPFGKDCCDIRSQLLQNWHCLLLNDQSLLHVWLNETNDCDRYGLLHAHLTLIDLYICCHRQRTMLKILTKILIKNILMLWTWSQERDRNISKTCIFIFHSSIQHDEGSGYTFYNEIDRPN